MRLASALVLGLCTASFAQISGKVTLEGTPPEMKEIKGMAAIPQCAQLHKDPVFEDTVIVGEKGELANVIVFIKEDKPGDLKGPKIDKPGRLDQKGCMYTPHVLAVEIGQPVVVGNSDPFLHNVHGGVVANKPFNIVQINVGDSKLEPFAVEETFHIKCDVHPWMNAVVRVFDHPYFATTGEDGKFTIDTSGLKDGIYSMQAWHELYKDSEPQVVEIKGGKAAKELDFTFKAGAKTQAAPMKEIHLASTAGQPECCKVTAPTTSD
jgi:hypothetical protein